MGLDGSSLDQPAGLLINFGALFYTVDSRVQHKASISATPRLRVDLVPCPPLPPSTQPVTNIVRAKSVSDLFSAYETDTGLGRAHLKSHVFLLPVGQRIAARLCVTERVLLVAFQVAALAAIGYWIFARPYRRYSSGAVATVALAGVGAFALIDGFSLAVVEESRARYGQVVTGVVEERLSTTGELGTRTIGGRRQYGRGPTVRTTGFDVYQTMTRAVVTGSFDAWVIDYRYPCSVPGGMCRERDFVPHDVWLRLEAGHPVNVRQSTNETRTARLDENPQRGLAIVKTALACVLFALAAVFSGRLTIFRRPKYVQADAIVTSVQPVKYGDDVRWKVHFAYFDAKGNAQDSVDEVNDPNWKSGDECYAVYRPQTPDVATLHGRAI